MSFSVGEAAPVPKLQPISLKLKSARRECIWLISEYRGGLSEDQGPHCRNFPKTFS